jgi:hypothetical protein
MKRSKLNTSKKQDRIALKGLLAVLNGAKNSLRRDECGDWTIRGSRGTVQSANGIFYAYLPCRSALAWTHAKKQLGLPISQDGDDEGIFRFQDLAPAQSEAFRHYFGIRQTKGAPPNAFKNGQIDL